MEMSQEEIRKWLSKTKKDRSILQLYADIQTKKNKDSLIKKDNNDQS